MGSADRIRFTNWGLYGDWLSICTRQEPEHCLTSEEIQQIISLGLSGFASLRSLYK
jgi:hypothetical protein